MKGSDRNLNRLLQVLSEPVCEEEHHNTDELKRRLSEYIIRRHTRSRESTKPQSMPSNHDEWHHLFLISSQTR